MKRDAVVFILAVVSGLFAFVLIFNYLNKVQKPADSYVIAAVDLPEGAKINAIDLAYSQPLENADGKNLFLQQQDVIGQVVTAEIPKGSLIRRDQVRPALVEPLKKVVPLPIPKGMRALTIAREDISNFPDLLEIGSYVDIVGLASAGGGNAEMKTILSSKKVISKDPLDSASPKSVTLAVRPFEAEAAIQSISRGKVRLIIRADAGEDLIQELGLSNVEVIRGVHREGVEGNIGYE